MTDELLPGINSNIPDSNLGIKNVSTTAEAAPIITYAKAPVHKKLLVLTIIIGIIIIVFLGIIQFIVTPRNALTQQSNSQVQPSLGVMTSTEKPSPSNTSIKLSDYEATLATNIEVGTSLIKSMGTADSVPESISLPNGSNFNLYHFKEEKKNPYCEDGDKSSTCLRQPIFGDYSVKSGFNCEGNILFNPLNPDINKFGFYYGNDTSSQTVPLISDFYTVIKSAPYELFTGSTYEGFLLKRSDNTCHPYKLTFSYLQRGTPPTDRSRLSAVKFNVSDNKISSTNYSDHRYGCGGSSTRLVENNLDILNYLEKVTELREGVALYTLKPIANFDDKILKFNFAASITSKILQDGGSAYLGDSEYSNEEKVEFINSLAREKSLIFVQDSIFPNVIFVYSSYDNIYYPGC